MGEVRGRKRGRTYHEALLVEDSIHQAAELHKLRKHFLGVPIGAAAVGGFPRGEVFGGEGRIVIGRPVVIGVTLGSAGDKALVYPVASVGGGGDPDAVGIAGLSAAAL